MITHFVPAVPERRTARGRGKGDAAMLPAPRRDPRATARQQRQDGWTPDRRRSFLEALSEGHTVEAACGHVGLSVASAYALRRRAGSEAFALGWTSACLLARDKLADALYSRALDGHTDTYTRADGETVTRHRYDNRLAMAMLTRLDKLAEHPAPDHLNPCDTTDPVVGARAVAIDFAGFLDLVEDDADAQTVADYVAFHEDARNPQLPQLNRAADDEDEADDAREEDEEDDDTVDVDADADEEEGDDGDEDEADAAEDADDDAATGDADTDAPGDEVRASHQLAAPEAPATFAARLSSLREENAQRHDALLDEARARFGDPGPAGGIDPRFHADGPEDACGPVWYRGDLREWHTNLAPPLAFVGEESGCHGDRFYWRTLDFDEKDVMIDGDDSEASIARLVALTQDY